MSILVFGSVNVDITVYAPRLPQPGETLHAQRYAIGLGGKGANQAAAAARLGTPTIFIGRTGRDEMGAQARGLLGGYGLDLAGVAEDDQAGTGIAQIIVGAADGQNIIALVAGANMRLGRADVERAAARLADTRVLLLQLETPLAASLDLAARARAAGLTVILDPAPAPEGGLDPAVLHAIDIITPNETETAALLGRRPATAEDAVAAARELVARGCRMAIVKLGGNGVAFYAGDGQEGFVPAFPVTVVDTVAAGDCFNGGLATALARGDTLPDAVRFAAACGAIAVTRPGAAAAAPTLAEVEALLRR